MAITHQFDVEIATLYGVNCAVILQNIYYWIKKNEANRENFHDGYYWTYNSTKALKELFPYLSKRQIEVALAKLKDEGIIITGNYNPVKYDRTLWYAITEKGKSILHTGEMDFTQKGNGFNPQVKPIPDINTNKKTQIITHIYSSVIDYLNQKAGTAYRAGSKATQAHINARVAEGFTLEDFRKVIDNKVEDWKGTEWEKFLRPETLFGTKFESYLNAKAKPEKKRDASLDDIF